MRELSWWIEWPIGVVRTGVVFLVAVAAAAALVKYPELLRERGEAAANGNALSYADREIAGGNGLVGDQQAVYQARARIPRDETYRVEVGEGYRGDTDLAAAYVGDFYTYFLMPRRPAEDAPWIICYGCDLTRYGSAAEVVWRNEEEGISLVRLRG